jgi:hypothetical protein
MRESDEEHAQRIDAMMREWSLAAFYQNLSFKKLRVAVCATHDTLEILAPHCDLAAKLLKQIRADMRLIMEKNHAMMRKRGAHLPEDFAGAVDGLRWIGTEYKLRREAGVPEDEAERQAITAFNRRIAS